VSSTACPHCRAPADLDEAGGERTCRRCATVLAAPPPAAATLEQALAGIDHQAWVVRRTRSRAAGDGPYRSRAEAQARQLSLAVSTPRSVAAGAITVAAAALLAALVFEWGWRGPCAAIAVVAAVTRLAWLDRDRTRIEIGPGTVTVWRPWRTLRLAPGAARRLRVRVVRRVQGDRHRYRIELVDGWRRRHLIELDQAWVAVGLAREIDATLGLPSGLLEAGATT